MTEANSGWLCCGARSACAGDCVVDGSSVVYWGVLIWGCCAVICGERAEDVGQRCLWVVPASDEAHARLMPPLCEAGQPAWVAYSYGAVQCNCCGHVTST